MSRPWYPLTIAIQNPATSLSLQQIQNAIVVQLGFGASTTSLNVRLRKLMLWGPIPVTNVPLVALVRDTFYDFPTGSVTDGVLEQITDFGDQVNRAKLGWEWPSAQQQKSLTAATTSTALIANFSGLGNGSVLYVDLLWRVLTNTPSAFALPSDSDSDSEVEVLTDNFEKLEVARDPSLSNGSIHNHRIAPSRKKSSRLN